MTHILIPITEALKEAIRIGDTSFLVDSMFSGKQISLDEKDIDETAKKYSESLPDESFKIWTGNEMVAFGYKQALKDLL